MHGVAGAHHCRNENIDRSSEQLLARVAEQAFRFGVDEHNLAVGADHDHAAWAGFDDKPESLVGQLALADIGDGAEHHEPVFRLDRIEPDLDRNLSAVFTYAVEVAANAHAARFRLGHEARPMAAMQRAPRFRHQYIDGSIEQFLAPIAEQALGLGVDQHDLAAGVGHDHAARASFDRETDDLLGSQTIGHGHVPSLPRFAFDSGYCFSESCKHSGRWNQVIE